MIRGFDGESYDRNIRELAEARAEIERLQKLVDRLTADYAKIHSCVQAYLDAPGQIRGEAFRDLAGTMEHLSGRDDAQGWAACYRRSEAEIERLRAIVDRLPKTKDGVPIIPCVDSVWHPDFTGSGTAKECGRAYWACYMRKIDECYSTREAAEAARREAVE
jgi:hypothetical protein